MGRTTTQGHPKSLAKACVFCRSRKIRCDTARPQCAKCVAQNKNCIYRLELPQKRPTLAEIQELKKQRSTLESFIIKLQNAPADLREKLLVAIQVRNSRLQLPEDDNGQACYQGQPQPSSPSIPKTPAANTTFRSRCGSPESLAASSDEECDISPFISLDEAGKPSSFGPSSALHCPDTDANKSAQSEASLERENVRNSLIAKAALQRQSERHLAFMPDVHGVPTELAMHLLDLHWSRQHHTFLLTYRPVIMRDLMCNGPNCSKFLLYAIFASSSKFSGRIEVRDNPVDPKSAGRWFFQQCDEQLAQDSLLIYPTVPTVVGLLLLGSTYNARGETSKGWLYTGYALRMVYDLGLHLDPKGTSNSPEGVELRRRVFWGAFVCDKLQSLYLGRPVAINLHDSHVSRDFMDTFEDQELYLPYIDPQSPNTVYNAGHYRPSPLYSVATFQQLCLLSRIMNKIIATFYVVGATPRNGQISLQLVGDALQTWQENLPEYLAYELSQDEFDSTPYPAPNVMNLHGTYHSLIILLHRPFISDGHLRSTATPSLSWGRCTSAARSITKIALAWKNAYGLIGAPYLLSYVIYVASTIHVRNAAGEASSGQSGEYSSLLAASLGCLDELCLANPGVSKPLKIIRGLIEARKIDLSLAEVNEPNYSPSSFDIDAIFSMFPTKNTSVMSMQSVTAAEMGSNLPDDPLYGLMNMPAMSFSDISLPNLDEVGLQ